MRRLLPLLLILAGPAHAQLLGGVGQLPGSLAGGLSPLLGPAGAPLGQVAAAPTPPLGIAAVVDNLSPPTAAALVGLRRDRLRALVRDNRRQLETDPDGNPVRRAELVATGLSDGSAAALAAAGFTILRDSRGESSGVRQTVLAAPKSQSLKQALARLRQAAPDAAADYNHVYEPAGGPLRPDSAAAAAGGATSAGDTAIGLVDGGVAAHPSLAAARIEQRGFSGPVAATGHGTAIASLLVGSAPHFSGAAPGARLLVADVFGGSAGNGSADSIARGLEWLGARGVRVINISLVGPPNALVAQAISALRGRGVIVVAAVGNDGPAAPPLYPASYDTVVAVTGVDRRGRVLIEAGRARHVDFAAPGADMAAALQAGGYAAVRGTSFAAPLVAARLAAHPVDAMTAVAREAIPARGKNAGRGIVCDQCRNDPRALAAK